MTSELGGVLTEEDIRAIGKAPLFPETGPRAGSFNLGDAPLVCDIVMKGGVTSGIVYPYAILRLAQKFRLAGIGGTSAGAIAAALTAAAEYGRQAEKDPASFSRFEQRCLELPKLMETLFQPYPNQRGAFEFANAAAQIGDKDRGNLRPILRMIFTRASFPFWIVVAGAMLGGMIGSIRHIFKGGIGHILNGGILHPDLIVAGRTALIGVISGALLLACFGWAVKITKRYPMWIYVLLAALAGVVPIEAGVRLSTVSASLLGGALGTVAGLVLVGDIIIGGLRGADFGMCPGLRIEGSETPGITDWLHQAIQDVARPRSGKPLTFGDIENAIPASDPGRMALRMITTNMTLRRPYALPDLGGNVGWRPSEWAKLFPADVVDYMASLGPDLDPTEVRPLPDGLALPVVVGARMSLSFPALFSAVPIYDITPGRQASRMLLIDGGLSSNMPLHFFDSLGPPVHPTFALNLRDNPNAGPVGPQRISLPQSGTDLKLELFPAGTLLGYLGGLLGAAKDWQDNLVSIMPGQFERIVTITLGDREGGLNLTMPPARSQILMQLGYRAGDALATQFRLPDHRIRRALAAYGEIERTGGRFGRGWTAEKLEEQLRASTPPDDSQAAWNLARDTLLERMGKLAELAVMWRPSAHVEHYPRPRGALRITPNLTGDL
ncbi:MAG: hypothetical protein ACXWKN_07685 [Phenylobacterium sp.]